MVRKALVAGCFLNTARRVPRATARGPSTYKTVGGNQEVFIHPSSVAFTRGDLPAETVVYHEVVMTRKSYMRVVTEVDIGWYPDLAPRAFKKRA